MAVLLALFLELFWTLALSQEGLPVITQHPTGGIYSSGSTVSLTCQAGPSVDTITWYRNGEQIDEETTHDIASFSAAVAGNYSCRATTNSVGAVTSALAELQLAALTASPPGTTNSPEQQTVQPHQPTTLTCGPIDSIPPTVYDWEIFEGLEIDVTADRAIKGIDGQLYLQDPQDNETFSCTADNNQAGQSHTGYIRVTVGGSGSDSPRVMMAFPQDITANVGDTISFQCIVGGSPVPQPSDIVWSYPDEVQTRETQNNAILTVRSVTTSDAGTYACNVTGLENQNMFSASLTVLVPPILSSSLTSQNVTFGQPLSLTCSVQDTLVSTWRWYRDGRSLEGTADGTLTLPSTDLSHSGVYQCFAYNSAGNDSSAALVSVQTIQATITVPPSPTRQLTFEGADITYTCSGFGAPPPSFTWFFNNLQLSENVETTDLTSTLMLPGVSVEGSGDYVCRVANSVDGQLVGSVESVAQLMVIEQTTITTEQPTYTFTIGDPDMLPCDATAQEGATLDFYWTKDSEPLNITNRLSYDSPGTSGTISISEVEEGDGGEYSCRVRTTYQDLVAPQEQTYTFNVTAVPESLIPPMLYSISTITSTSFTVQWYFPGARAQTRLTSYTLSYRLAAETEPLAERTQSISALTEYTFANSEETPVKPYTKYVVTVWANYEVGGSVPSNNETVMTLEDVPGAPEGVSVGVVNNSAVLVEWEPPSSTNGIITNYTIRYKLTVSNSVYRTLPLPTNATRHMLTGLLQRASYQVQVAGSTAVGMGPYSEEVAVFTEKEESSSSTPIHQRVWFILVIFILGVLAIIAVVLVICGIRYLLSPAHSKSYNVRARVGGLNEKLRGRSGFGGGGRTGALSLTEDAMVDYEGRGRRNGEAINGDYATIKAFEALESESSLADPFKYSYEPSLSTTGSRVSSQAPPYINPPSFEEALKRPRLHSAYSSSTIDHQPPSIATYTESDWALEANSKTRMIEEVSPSHSGGREPSPLPSLGEQPTHPPLRPEGETYPSPPRRRHASHGGVDWEEEQAARRVDRQTQPTSLEELQGTSGYNHLPVRQLSHDQVPPKKSSSLTKASSQPNFATFV